MSTLKLIATFAMITTMIAGTANAAGVPVTEVERTIDQAAAAKFLTFQKLKTLLDRMAKEQTFNADYTSETITAIRSFMKAKTQSGEDVFDANMVGEMFGEFQNMSDYSLVGAEVRKVRIYDFPSSNTFTENAALALDIYNQSLNKGDIRNLYIVFKDASSTADVLDTGRIIMVCKDRDVQIETQSLDDAKLEHALKNGISVKSALKANFQKLDCIQ